MNYRNPIHWRLRQPRYRLIGSVCSHCGRPLFPPGRPCCQPRPAASSGLGLVWIKKPHEGDEVWIKGVDYAVKSL
jgi:uncharacterized OB-fold protein